MEYKLKFQRIMRWNVLLIMIYNNIYLLQLGCHPVAAVFFLESPQCPGISWLLDFRTNIPVSIHVDPRAANHSYPTLALDMKL